MCGRKGRKHSGGSEVRRRCSRSSAVLQTVILTSGVGSYGHSSKSVKGQKMTCAKRWGAGTQPSAVPRRRHSPRSRNAKREESDILFPLFIFDPSHGIDVLSKNE